MIRAYMKTQLVSLNFWALLNPYFSAGVGGPGGGLETTWLFGPRLLAWKCAKKKGPPPLIFLTCFHLKMKPSWWLNQPLSQNMLVKMGSPSPNGGENSKNIWVATTQKLLVQMIFPSKRGNFQVPCWFSGEVRTKKPTFSRRLGMLAESFSEPEKK